MKTTVQNESYSGWNTWSVRDSETGEIITSNLLKEHPLSISEQLEFDGKFFQKFKFCFYHKKYGNSYNFISYCTKGYSNALEMVKKTINTVDCHFYLCSIS